jgi:hypothetical protein
MKRKGKILAALFAVLVGLPLTVLAAYHIEKIDNVGTVKDFVVGPGKIELTINPGESASASITVTNRLGSKRDFLIETEDFTGSSNPDETVALLGNDRGPFSIKDNLVVAERTFSLENGERATIPVKVSVPSGTQPGALYGSVIVSALPEASKELGKNAVGSTIVTRIGTLFFVTIPGEAKKDGILKEFSIAGNSNVFSSGPINFRLLFENKGNVYLKPSGQIRIKNILGQEVEVISVDPWFAMPSSLRSREVNWPRELLFGRYEANAQISRGYGNMVDEKSVTFWVWPVGKMLAVFAGIILLVLLVRWIFSNFKIERK